MLDISRDAPLLIEILANNDSTVKQKADGKGLSGRRMTLSICELNDAVNVEVTLTNVNDDPRVHGILVCYPTFGHEVSLSSAFQDVYFRDSVSYKWNICDTVLLIINQSME